jgi:tetratricopeptide (TPR) repeat protein
MRISQLMYSILTIIGVLGLSTSSQAQQITEGYQFVEGDILVQKENSWKTLKILNVEKFEGKQTTLHAMIFEDSKDKPTLSSLEKTSVKIYHAPIAAMEFVTSWELLGNGTIKNSDLIGFIEYLKQTNFQRYAEFTNQNMDKLISLANLKYKNAYALGKQSNFKKAIELYLEAIDIFPMFIEAVDNIAFAYMDMGDNENAIRYFNKSLNLEPNGFTALYYKGQCFINLRDLDSAIDVFQDGMSRFPEKKAAFEEIYLKLQNMRSNG